LLEGSVVPPRGFVYDQPVAGTTRSIAASDRRSLIDALTTFRVANNIEIGDPPREIDEQLGKRSPIYHPPINSGSTNHKPLSRTLTERVRDWIANRYSTLSKLEYVNSTIATQRADICQRCPHNIEWRSNCRACVDEVERNIVIVGKRKSLPHELFACNVCGHENRVAVWLTEKHLRHADRFRDKLPRFCWLKQSGQRNNEKISVS
jgi:hypothetical protein